VTTAGAAEMATDRWHKARPNPGEQCCREHDQVPMAAYGHPMSAGDGRMKEAVDPALEGLFSDGGALNVPSVDG
jgi:hypothetical protein